MADVIIRQERPRDHRGIEDLLLAAFGSDAEARLVAAIRASANYIPELTLVAVDGHLAVGHVMVSRATLREGRKDRPVAVLAPLAVLPERQREGIGTSLVEAVAVAADQRGEPLLILQGSPRFYRRVGFEPAAALGIDQDLPDWAPAEASQVRRLGGYDPALRGRLIYPPAFDVVE
jgi:putative acetyltransferase